jgi:hypothetical protein
MERTDDLLRLVTLFQTDDLYDIQRKTDLEPSQYLNLAQHVATNIDGNEVLVRRMEKLSKRKEFSNDPTVEMTEISDLFHLKVSIIQRQFETLKKMTEDKQHQVRIS